METRKCGNCQGQGGMWVTPYRVSPPSFHRGDDGGYEPHSNVKTKVRVKCDGCDGKGHRLVQTS